MNRICAPFLIDKSQTQLTPGNYLTRPYIERVIQTRFDNTNVTASTNGINDFINTQIFNFIKDNVKITDPTLVNAVVDPLRSLHTDEVTIFAKFINVIDALITTLAKAYIEIDCVRGDINWKPIPNIGGPEFGSILNDVNGNDTTNNKQIEIDINIAQLHKFIEETNFAIGINSPDLANFTFSNMDDMIFDVKNDNNSGFLDNQLNNLINRRTEKGNKANDLLKQIEIITGEFSGLGLLDVMAIQATLWIMDSNALLGLIDDVALSRMQTNRNLKTDISGRMNPFDALNEFSKKISEVYVIMQGFYQNMINFDGKNK